MANVLEEIGHAGARGWRERVADTVAPRLASRMPAGQERAKAAVGLLFVVLSVVYLAGTLKAFRAR